MSQLSGQIARFDTEIGERYRVFQELIGEFDANEEIRKNLEEETKRQSDECDVFLARIEEQRLAILQEKLKTFVQNRAAKIIQRWWRPIYQRRRKLRKKKKKGKKVCFFSAHSQFHIFAFNEIFWFLEEKKVISTTEYF